MRIATLLSFLFLTVGASHNYLQIRACYGIRARFVGHIFGVKHYPLATVLNFLFLTVGFIPLTLHSAIACLPESSVQKLVPDIEIRERLKEIQKDVEAISSDNALRIYHDNIQKGDLLRSMDCEDHSEEIFHLKADSSSNKLESHCKELLQLLCNCPKITVGEKLGI